MGSGEAEVNTIRIPSAYIGEKTISNNTTGGHFQFGNWVYPSTSSWTYTTHIYLYQIFCPRRKCKTANWLELDKIKECIGCGARLQAVLDQPDYVVPVTQ